MPGEAPHPNPLPRGARESDTALTKGCGARAAHPGHPWNRLCRATGCAPFRGVTPKAARGVISYRRVQRVAQRTDHAVNLRGRADERRCELDRVATVAHVKTLLVHGHGDLVGPACRF